MGKQETYLGDGLYASFDGFQIWLRAPHEHGAHVVALEPGVWNALNEFVAALSPGSTKQMALETGAEAINKMAQVRDFATLEALDLMSAREIQARLLAIVDREDPKP